MVALALWGWFAALRARGWSGLVVAALLLALSAMFKHTMLASAAALVIWLVIDGRQRRAPDAVRRAVGLAAIVGGLFTLHAVALMILTRGAWLANTVTSLRSSFVPDSAFGLIWNYNILQLLPLLGGVAACLGMGSADARTRPLRWAFGLSLLACEAMIMRAGSNVHYYLEANCWGALLAAPVLREGARACLARGQALRRAGGVALMFMCLLWLRSVQSANLDIKAAPELMRKTPGQLEKLDPRIVTMLGQTRGPILTTDGFLCWLTTAPTTAMDLFLYSQRVQAGGLSPEPLAKMIREGAFELIILTWDLNEPFTYQGVPRLPDESHPSHRPSATP